MVQYLMPASFGQIHIEKDQRRAGNLLIGVNRLKHFDGRMTVCRDLHVSVDAGQFEGFPNQKYICFVVFYDQNAW